MRPENPPTRVLWIAPDDGLLDRARPRFEAVGVDVRRLAAVGPELPPSDAFVVEMDDVADAGAFLRRLGADGAPVLLVFRGRVPPVVASALRAGHLDLVDGTDPEPELVVARLQALLEARDHQRVFGRLHREMSRRILQLRMIQQVAQGLASTLEPEQLLVTAAESLHEILGYPGVAIWLEEEPRGRLGRRVARGPAMPPDGAAPPEVVARAASEGGPAQRDDGASVIAVPIRATGRTRGVLEVRSERPGELDEADLGAIETLADQIGSSLANAWLYDELRRRAREIEGAYRRLRKTDRLKDDFLSSVSHEFRTPLSSIRSFTEILLSSPGEDEATVREFLSIIHEESLRLSRMVDNLLDLSKIRSGIMKWTMVEAEPVAVARRAIRAASSLAHDRETPIRLHVEGDPQPVRMDVDRMIQVLLNLLANAIKFSEPGTPIDVTVATDERELALTVADRGRGIASYDLPYVFDRFRQAADVERGKPAGTGLGLAICREIVKRHGGTIDVESKLGLGSRFTFRIPRRDPVTAPPEPIA